MLHRGEPDILVTQNDVRAIQLAKAALYAGIKLLMERMGIDHVDQIRLAGAFGSHIEPKYAVALGLVPDCDIEHVTAAGTPQAPEPSLLFCPRKRGLRSKP